MFRFLARARARLRKALQTRKRPFAKAPPWAGKQLVFVGGLHRSGTSVLHRLLRSHPQVSGFQQTGVPEDEGQHLQTVFAPARKHGGPGRFAFDAAAHLTEASRLVSARNRDRLLCQWGPYWDWTKRVLAEKSPPNLIRARFLQALFPRARFVFIVRHPIAVSLATVKMAQATVQELASHWCHAHRLFLDDLPLVRDALVIRYEDLAADRDAYMEQVWRAAGLDSFAASEAVVDHNAKYLAQWQHTPSKAHTVEDRFPSESRPLYDFGYSWQAPYVERAPPGMAWPRSARCQPP